MYVYLSPLPPFSFVLKFSNVKSGCFNMLKLCHRRLLRLFPVHFHTSFQAKTIPAA